MKIYIDKIGRLTGYEMVFYKGKRPKTRLETGHEARSTLLTIKQNRWILDYLDNGGRVTDLTYDRNSKELVEKKLERAAFVCGLDLHKTILVDTFNFKPNSDLKRHFQETSSYVFKELSEPPYDEIKSEYLYESDKMILELIKSGRIRPTVKNRRYFALYKGDVLAGFIFTNELKNLPQISILYQDEAYNNAGYIIVYNLVNLLKVEKVRYLDLGGLTREDSGINQFKQKWGKNVFAKDIEKHLI